MSTTRGYCSMIALGLSLTGATLLPSHDRQAHRSSQGIAEAQAILQQAGYLAPGDYRKGENDESTREALRRFQSRHGLAPTGTMDRETMIQLSSHAETAADGAGKSGLVLKGVRFDPDTAHLTLGSRATLDHLARSLASSPDGRFQVAGYTDSTNTEAHNLELSRARSAAVCGYLVDKGVASARLQEKGYGESHPIADNTTAAGRAINRRVEITRID